MSAEALTSHFCCSVSIACTILPSTAPLSLGVRALLCVFATGLKAELAEANRKADQRIISARAVQLDLEKLRPRVCRLVASVTGTSARVFGGAEESEWSTDVTGGGGWSGDRWARGGGLLGYGTGAGVGKDEPRTLSGVLRRLAEGKISHAMSAHLVEAKHAAAGVGSGSGGGGGSGSPSVSMSATAARAYPYSLFLQDFADDPFRGSRAPAIGGASTRALARGRRAAGLAAAAAAVGGGSSAPDPSQEGLRASLDELCNLHEELGAIGRMDPGSDSNIGRLMSIQMRRAETEARLEEHAAAMSDATQIRESAAEAARAAAADAARDRTGARRMRIGEPYIPNTRRLVAAPAPAPSAEADEAEDGTDSSATSPAVAAASAATTSSTTASADAAKAARSPYAREGGNLYIPPPPRGRRTGPQRDDGGIPSANRSGASGTAAVNAQWERQPTGKYIPAARRRPQSHDPEPSRQSSTSASRSVRAAAAAVAAATTSGSSGPSPHSQAPAAPAPAAALFFPPSSTARGGGGVGGGGQPPPMPSAAFQFGRTSSASAGLRPVFPGSGGSSAAPSHRPSGAGVSVRRARTTNRRGSRAEETERFLTGNPADEGGDGAEAFFSALPPLPPPAPQYRTKGASASGAPSSASASISGNAAAAAADAAAATRGAAGSGAGTGAPSDGDPAAASQGQQASEVAPELAELVDLYCGRCQDAQRRLRSAVAEREALSASTLAYLRRGRREGAGGSFTAGAGGGTAGSNATTASLLSRTAARRGSTSWGGDGGQAGVRGTDKGVACCSKCTEEVSCSVSVSAFDAHSVELSKGRIDVAYVKGVSASSTGIRNGYWMYAETPHLATQVRFRR